ncbi:MAG TPA: methionyl-tRNA formyltransferase [Candidatus Paceibacterota bacterium]
MSGRSPIKFAFFGTPAFAVKVLEELEKKGLLPAIVVTNPDRPQGRSLRVLPSPVKSWAQKHKCAILQPETLDEQFIEHMRLAAMDVFVVAAYGKILPEKLIYLPPRRSLNVHPSLLPKYRGATPIESAIIDDEHEIGVTIICLDKDMDHGPIVAQERAELKVWPMSAPLLEHLLAEQGGRLLARILSDWLFKKIRAVPQHHTLATYTKKIKKDDGLIDFNDNPRKNYLKYLAFDPWPGVYYWSSRGDRRKRIIIKKASFSDGEFIIERILPEGGREIPFSPEFKI